MHTNLTDWCERWWVIIFAALVLFTAPQHAAELKVSPDSVEYAVMAHRLAMGESPLLPIAGSEYPSRYPVLFSMIMAPLYALFPASIGAGVLLVWLFSLLCVYFVKAIVEEATQKKFLGDIAAVTLLTLGIFRATSHQILADIPFVCSMLALVWAMLDIERRRVVFILASLLIFVKAIGVILVPVMALYLILSKKSSVLYAVELCLIAVGMFVVQMLVNLYLFGGSFQSGYSYWVHDLYGGSMSIFKIENIWINAQKLLNQPDTIVVLFSVVIFLIDRRKRGTLGSTERAAVTGVTVLSLVLTSIMLIHGWYEPRLFLPLYILTPILLGIGIQSFLPEHVTFGSSKTKILCAAILLAIGAYSLIQHSEVSKKLRALQLIASQSSRNDVSTVVTTDNPLYVEYVLYILSAGEKHFNVLPFDRTVEYASKRVFEENESREVFEWTVTDNESFDSFIAGHLKNVFVYCPNVPALAKASARCQERFRDGTKLEHEVLKVR